MIEQKYWKDFYKSHKFEEPSPFAQYAIQFIDGEFVDLGCGDGRDLYFFLKNNKLGSGVDASNGGLFITQQTIEDYIKENESPENVYTRFFWHAIPRETQLDILQWTKKRLFIEARTTHDRPKNIYGKHDRNLVDIEQLGNDLGENGFQVTAFQAGHGLSKYLNEDPHLVRLIAIKE